MLPPRVIRLTLLLQSKLALLDTTAVTNLKVWYVGLLR